MPNAFKKIFSSKKAIIGAIHLPPLLGYPEFPGFDIAIKNALTDLKEFERGGVDGVIFENNYDLPHEINVDPAVAISMAIVGGQLKRHSKLPMGVSVLWNDYRTALALAKALRLQFIRLPVFVDTVKTAFGTVKGEAEKVIAYRKKISAHSVAIFVDIHVKHAELISKTTIMQSARLAMDAGADGVIVTGKWTGQAPDMGDLLSVRKQVKNFPIFIGSGVDEKNISALLSCADAAIVSTSLKKGVIKKGERNVKGYAQRIDRRKVGSLVAKIRK